MQHTNEPCPQPQPAEEDGLSLVDVLSFIINGWKTICSTALIGIFAGTSYAIFAPEKFQAEVIVQGAVVSGQVVEPIALLVEKLKQPTYFSDKTVVDCELTESPTAKSTLAKNLKPAMSKTSPIVTLSYTGKTALSAKTCLESVIGDIAKDQEMLASPLIKIREDQLANTKTKIALAEKVTDQLGGKKINFDIPDQKFSSSTLLYSIILSKQNEITDLRKSIETQTVELAPPQTKPAGATTPIYAPDLHVSPKRFAAIVGGLFGGALLGIIWLLAQHAWKNIKPQLCEQLPKRKSE